MAQTSTKTTQNLITKGMTIGDVVAKYPKTASIMMSHGLHCIGCAVNPYETIENGALGHGMPQEEIDAMIGELNKIVSEPARAKDNIYFTDRAVNKMKELAVAENKIDQALRVQVKAAGCHADRQAGSGWEYFMDFAAKPEADEKERQLQGLKVYISDASWGNLLGGEIDYVVTPEGEGFKIDNPNKAACKCEKN